MLPDRVSNPGPLTYESGALPIALRGPQMRFEILSTDTISIRTCVFGKCKTSLRMRTSTMPDEENSDI